MSEGPMSCQTMDLCPKSMRKGLRYPRSRRFNLAASGKLLEHRFTFTERQKQWLIIPQPIANELESSSHGMAYLILVVSFLLAFTRYLRGSANATIHANRWAGDPGTK